MDNKIFFVTGISTEVGKTIASAILVEALESDYWKPIQSGDLHFSDSDKIQSYISNKKTKIHPETFRLNTPASPHYSAEIDKIKINLNDFKIPKTDNHLIIEGAGGLLVPLNNEDTILDLIRQLNIPIILVANFYLGSINHTLLSINYLFEKNIKIDTLIFMGVTNNSSRDIIIKMTKGKIQNIIDIPHIEKIDKTSIYNEALKIKKHLS